MKASKILKELQKIENRPHNKYEEYMKIKIIDFDNLIKKLENEAIKENIPENSTKKQVTAIIRFLNSKHNQSRPVLTYTHYKDDYQVFTDSYMLFRFFNDSIIETLPNTKYQKNLPAYPNTEKIINPVKNEGVTSESYNIKELLQKIRLLKSDKIELSLNDNLKVLLDKKKLKDFITIMLFKNSDMLQFKYFNNSNDYYTSLLYASNGLNKEGIILPCRP